MAGKSKIYPIEIGDPDRMKAAMTPARRKGAVIGLVPTLGALHDGHGALIKKAKKECAVVVVSIFINPLQFRKKAFDHYPRNIEEDRALLASLEVDYLFAPSITAMYPDRFDTVVEVKDLAGRLEGGRIRWHYRGVTTVVAKLFSIIQPDRAYFGKKDPHQLAIIRRMTRDLNLSPRIIGVPTRRAKDGLALSSRNEKLTSEERRAARVIPAALEAAEREIARGKEDRAYLVALMTRIIEKEPLAKIDYLAAVDADSLREEVTGKETLLYAAVYIGPWRLTDNRIVNKRR